MTVLELQEKIVVLLQADKTQEMLTFLAEYNTNRMVHRFAMQWAARWNKQVVFQWLVDHSSHLLGEPLDHAPELSYADQLLYIACFDGAIDTARVLVETCGARIDAIFNSQEQEVLARACTSGNAALVRYLLEHGAKPNITTAVGPVSFPLLHAASVGNLAVARVLVEHGAAVNGLNPFGLPPLSYALMNGNPEMIAYLRSVGGLEPWQLRGESGPPEPEPEPPPTKGKPKKRK